MKAYVRVNLLRAVVLLPVFEISEEIGKEAEVFSRNVFVNLNARCDPVIIVMRQAPTERSLIDTTSPKRNIPNTSHHGNLYECGLSHVLSCNLYIFILTPWLVQIYRRQGNIPEKLAWVRISSQNFIQFLG